MVRLGFKPGVAMFESADESTVLWRHPKMFSVFGTPHFFTKQLIGKSCYS